MQKLKNFNWKNFFLQGVLPFALAITAAFIARYQLELSDGVTPDFLAMQWPLYAPLNALTAFCLTLVLFAVLGKWSRATGPNMAGKSTYMRQNALIALMAQIGSFVPAASAHLGVVDAIFTRVGASDDLAAGQSTFMVEMTEVAEILKHATRDSLVILDEIGRGTSTFDGMSIARAVVEYICENIGCKTLFATHYHELTSMDQDIHGVKNYNIAVKKRGEDITFLRRIIAGPADDSYGIEVAKLAGLPGSVTKRAHAVLRQLEANAPGRSNTMQLDFETVEAYNNPSVPSEVVDKLHSVDIETLTPLEALNFLYELKTVLDKE